MKKSHYIKKDKTVKKKLKKDETITKKLKNDETVKKRLKKDETVKKKVRKNETIKKRLKKDETVKKRLKKDETVKKKVRKNEIVKKTKTRKKLGGTLSPRQFPPNMMQQRVLYPQQVQNYQQEIKLLSQGGYGCVINRSLDILRIHANIIPAIYTIDQNLFITEDMNDKYITKISMDELSTYAEINMNIKLIEIYKNEYLDSFLPILKKYAVYSDINSDIRRLNIPNISRCLSSISNSNKNIFGEIVYEKSGSPLSNTNFKFKLYLDLLITFYKNLKDFHRKGFVHRDIKHDNVLYNVEKNKLVLIDFGTTYNISDINNGNFFVNSDINQLSNNPHLWFNTGLEYLLIHPPPYKLSDRLIHITRMELPDSNKHFIDYLNGQLQFINNFTEDTLKNYFYATDYYACGLMMNQMVNKISFDNINEKSIYDHITYILTLINPEIRTTAFENMILIFDKYKETNNIILLKNELIQLFTNKYLEQQYNNEQKSSKIVKIISTNNNNLTRTHEIHTTAKDYNYNGENLKYLPNKYKVRMKDKFYKILKDLFADFRYVFRKKK